MMKLSSRFAHMSIALLMIASMGFSAFDTPHQPPHSLSLENTSPKNADEDLGTPLQEALKRAIEERRSEGLPTPVSLTYDFEVTGETDAFSSMAVADMPEDTTATGITIIEFDIPQEAGYEEWPALIVEEEMPNGAMGSVEAGDYSDAIRDALEEAFPGIWEEYKFGHEPRRYTFEETFVVVYPEPAPRPIISPFALDPQEALAEDILFGFTYSGPQIDYTISFKQEACFKILGKKHCITIAEAKAGFQLDWTLGIRLPTEMTINLPEVMVQGCSYWPTTSMHPMDWQAEQYRAAGIPRHEGGNEFLLSYDFFLGVKAAILGRPVVQWYIETQYDASRSFRTPFGPGETFELPELYLPPDLTMLQFPINIQGLSIGSIGIGLGITPKLGSDKLSATWQVLPDGDAYGSGEFQLNRATTPVSFGPIEAGDFSPADYAQIQLSGYRYWFTQFMIQLSATIELELFQFGRWKSPPIDIIDAIDLSRFGFTKDLWIGPHKGTKNAILATIPVLAPLDTAQDMASNEGEMVALSDAAFALCGISNPDNITIDWGDGTPIESGSMIMDGMRIALANSHIYIDNGLYKVEICASDKKGSSACAVFHVSVANLAPVVNAGGPQTISEGQTLILNASSFTDAGLLDTHSATINWGDGSPIEQALVNESMGSGSVFASHAYGDNGIFEVILTICDKDQDCSEDRFQVTVENVAPDVRLDRSAAISFADGEAFLQRKGLVYGHQATALDPGSDDLTFQWSFAATSTYLNDGLGPDPLNSPWGVFPFEAIDSVQVAFDIPGLHKIEIEVLDDDQASAQDSLAVLVTDDHEGIQSRSYWLKQFSDSGDPQIDRATLQAYLDLINYASAIFPEKVSLGTIEEAQHILAIKNKKIRSTLDAHLLVAWLNFAQGTIGWEQQIDTNLNCRGDTPFHQVITRIEASLSKPSLSNNDLIRTGMLIEALRMDDKGKPLSCLSLSRLKIPTSWLKR